MSNEIIVAFIAFLGTMAGTAGGIIASSKLTNFRLQKLEEKVDKHNSVIERTFRLEEQIKVANHRIGDLEDGRGFHGGNV
ncbi:MAG: hypothetical protein PHE79_08580 [Eubacteriales bacterium]|nr:hypothetical protein [Eubacteriales bacterium]